VARERGPENASHAARQREIAACKVFMSLAIQAGWQAGGPGIRSPAHARAGTDERTSMCSSTPWLAHQLCGKREWGLRPDTQTTSLTALLARREKPADIPW
jgi:hypothetical protein